MLSPGFFPNLTLLIAQASVHQKGLNVVSRNRACNHITNDTKLALFGAVQAVWRNNKKSRVLAGAILDYFIRWLEREMRLKSVRMLVDEKVDLSIHLSAACIVLVVSFPALPSSTASDENRSSCSQTQSAPSPSPPWASTSSGKSTSSTTAKTSSTR